MPEKDVFEFVSWGNLLSLLVLAAGTALVVFLYGRLAALVAERSARWRIQILGSAPIFRLAAWLAAASIGVFAILQPPEETLLAVAASAGLALGLGVQDVVKNVLAGIVMVFQRPLTVGDMVSVGGHYGEVIGMDLSAIRLRTFDDNVVTVPNALVLNHAVLNSNAGAVHELVAVPFTLFGPVDVQAVRRIAAEAAACSPYVYLRAPITVVAEDASDWRRSTRFTVKAYVIDVRQERAMSTDVFARLAAHVPGLRPAADAG